MTVPWIYTGSIWVLLILDIIAVILTPRPKEKPQGKVVYTVQTKE